MKTLTVTVKLAKVPQFGYYLKNPNDDKKYRWC